MTIRNHFKMKKLYHKMVDAAKENRESNFVCVIDDKSDGSYVATVTEQDECGGVVEELFTVDASSEEWLENAINEIFNEARNLYLEWHRIKSAE